MLYMYVQRFVSFKFPRPQITVVTNQPCCDTVTLNPHNLTELHGIAVALLCDELTGDELTASQFHYAVQLASRSAISSRRERELVRELDSL